MNTQSPYFLGIGGIGMSALARYFHRQGCAVSGYDRVSSVVTRALEEEGMNVFYQESVDHLEGKDLVVYTPAIPHDSLELQAAQASDVPLKKRSEVLGILSQEYNCLAVAGTHGKTTTTAMLAHLLRHSGVDTTAFLGGISNNLNSNFAFGASDYMVAEADEFDRSFLTLHPHIAAITSLDADHLDIYGDGQQMKTTYRAFAQQVTGTLLVQHEFITENWGREYLTFGLDAGDFQARNLTYIGLEARFDFQLPDGKQYPMVLNMPGRHNVSNAIAALAICSLIGIEPEKLQAAIADFSGIYRRFEVKVHNDQYLYIDDYAHHPTEIVAAIHTARALYPERKLVVVFQPHLFSRTRDFLNEFAEALSQADEVILMDIYPARELPIPGVSSEILLNAMSLKNKSLVKKDDLPTAVSAGLQSPCTLLTLGAGDIDREVPAMTQLVQTLSKESNPHNA
ncbi:MAG: UDP-N-acetylmuramate--L-alanine ligase [Bacteroidota bacterium]